MLEGNLVPHLSPHRLLRGSIELELDCAAGIRPLGVIFTNACNRRCAYCFREHGYPRARFMSPADFEAMRAWAVANEVKSFKLAGGEPTQHPDFLAMTESLHELIDERAHFHIISNLLCDASKLAAFRRACVLVNTDSPDQYSADELALLMRGLEVVAAQDNVLTLSFTIWRPDQPDAHLFEYCRRFGISQVRVDLSRPSKLRRNRAITTSEVYGYKDKLLDLARRLRAQNVFVHFDCPLPIDLFTKEELDEIRPGRLRLVDREHVAICECFYVNPDLSTCACPHQLLLERPLTSFEGYSEYLRAVMDAKVAKIEIDSLHPRGFFYCEAERFLP